MPFDQRDIRHHMPFEREVAQRQARDRLIDRVPCVSPGNPPYSYVKGICVDMTPDHATGITTFDILRKL